MHNRLQQLAAIIAVFLLQQWSVLPSSVWAASVDAQWVHALDGNWTDASNWSTNPNYPLTGTPSGTTYAVGINQTGSPYVVSLTAPPSVAGVDSLTIGGTGSLRLTNIGSFTVDGDVNVGDGTTLFLRSSRLVGEGARTTTGTGRFVVEFDNNNSLGGSTISGNVLVENGASLRLGGELQPGTAISMAGSGRLDVASSIAGTGVINCVTAVSGGLCNIDIHDGTTIQSGITIRTVIGSAAIGGLTSDTWENYGTILSEAATRFVTTTSPMQNHGALHTANGGSIRLLRKWTNVGGTIKADTGAIVSVNSIPAAALDVGVFQVHDGQFTFAGTIANGGTPATTAQIRALDLANSVISISGAVTNTGAEIPVQDGTNTWHLDGGTITNGSITGGSIAPLLVQSSATIQAVSLGADVNMSGGSRLEIAGNSVVGTGRTLRLTAGLGVGSLSTILSFGNNVTWGAGSQIILDGTSNNNVVASNGQIPLVLPSTLQIVTGSGGGSLPPVNNQGRIASTNSARTVTLSGKNQNSGTIEALGGDVVGQTGTDTFGPVPFALINDGTLRAGVGGDFTFTGSLQQPADGTMEFDLAGSGSEDFGQLTASNGIQLGGTLRAVLNSGFEPNVGATFPIILSTGGAGVSGTFSNVDFPTWTNGRTFDVSYTSGGVSLVVIAPEPAGLAVCVASAAMAGALRRRR